MQRYTKVCLALFVVGVLANVFLYAHPHPPATHGPGGDPPHSQAFNENVELLHIDGDVGGEDIAQALDDLFMELDHKAIGTVERVALIEESIGDGIATSEQLNELIARVAALEVIHNP